MLQLLEVDLDQVSACTPMNREALWVVFDRFRYSARRQHRGGDPRSVEHIFFQK